MRISQLLLFCIGLTVFSGFAMADAPLKTVLGLNVDQAKEVAEIQGEYRRVYAAKRGEHNREARALRRAKTANDAEAIVVQERVVAKLREELVQIKASEDEAIRKVLNAEQNKKFDEYIAKRDGMAGSSRDIR